MGGWPTAFDYRIILLQIVLIGGLVWWSVYKQISYKKPALLLVFLGLFVMAFVTRIYEVETVTPGMLSDELTIAKTSEEAFSSPVYIPFSEKNLGHSTPLLYLNGLFIDLFGRRLMAIRMSSIIFGALTIPVFYLLVRRFTSTAPAVLSALIFNFSYVHILSSRFGNEIAAAIFFETLSALLLTLIIQTRRPRLLPAFAVTLGLGVLTYLSFRTYAVVFLLIALIAVNFYPRIKTFLIVTSVLLLTTFPLISYSVARPSALWARVNSISVFNQNLSTIEVSKEIAASGWRLSRLFVGPGDPDFRQNPALTAMFDPLTAILFAAGLVITFKRNRKLFYVILALAVTAVINDVLTIEIIPEARYYGMGHPFTFRISGLIPIIYFIVALALDKIIAKINLRSPQMVNIFVIFVFTPILIINCARYFGQKQNWYIYIAHNVRTLNLVKIINSQSYSQIAVSPSIYEDGLFHYFSKTPLINIEDDKMTVRGISALSTQMPVIIDAFDSKELAKQVATSSSLPSTLEAVINPWNITDYVLLIPK